MLTLGMLYWIIMIVWFLFGVYQNHSDLRGAMGFGPAFHL